MKKKTPTTYIAFIIDFCVLLDSFSNSFFYNMTENKMKMQNTISQTPRWCP